jgi:signal transduction histidine kinase
MRIDFGNGIKLLYYKDNPEIKTLTWFPYIQFGLIGLLVFIAYLLFSTFRKAEQNQVWAGMAKETAHQLGTPLSSLMAWVNHLESQQVDAMMTTEMQKDLDRLSKITERFSKIGSEAKFEPQDLVITIGENLEYLRSRFSNKVKIVFDVAHEGPLIVPHNVSLMEWAVENICKNAVDAMDGIGELKLSLRKEQKRVYLDIADTGKGLTKSQFNTIFQPGYSTKKRGWGLGLTLVKRIIEEYHKGKVFVLKSELDKGTVFRIVLKSE